MLLCCAVGLERMTGAREARLDWPQLVKPIHPARAVVTSDLLCSHGQHKFIHAFFRGRVNEIRRDLMMCGHRPCGFNQWLVNSLCALDTATLRLSANWLLRPDIVSEFWKIRRAAEGTELKCCIPLYLFKS